MLFSYCFEWLLFSNLAYYLRFRTQEDNCRVITVKIDEVFALFVRMHNCFSKFQAQLDQISEEPAENLGRSTFFRSF